MDMYGKLIGCEKSGQSIAIQFEDGTGYLDIFSETIINVFAGIHSREHYSKAIEDRDKKRDASQTEVKIEKEAECIVVKTTEITAKVYDEFKIDFYDKTGKLVCKDYRGNREKQRTISPAFLELMEQEGHKDEHKDNLNIPVQAVKEMLGDEHFYGLGDKTGYLDKRWYEYEMWNADIPSPHEDNFKRLYKDLPFFITLGDDYRYGIFFDNTFHAYFDLGKEQQDYYFFGAEDGNLDYYYIGGASIPEIVEHYTWLTGRTPLPQLWTLGYHQSRWGYVTEEDIMSIAKGLRENQIPCDAIHMDIDYMDGYRVFTWNQKNYKDPKKALENLAKDGFKPVCIIDPGVKLDKDYKVYQEGIKNNYFATTPEGETYVNAVWPGDSVYPDFGKAEVQSWWADKQKFLVDLGVRGVWNDMNEPASFKGELPLDVVFHDGDRKTDHSEIHNVYGHFMSKATYEGLQKHDSRRPFVITRACYAGTQKYAMGWTGDNHSIWRHLEMAVPQLCSMGLSGLTFAGTDVGGFGSDTTPELLSRWVQVGCLSPFFRNHSCLGTKLQEPWQFDEKTLEINRKYINLRYELLPYYYDLFHEQEQTGHPVMRPLIYQYEQDKNVRTINDEFMVGENLLAAPVLHQGVNKRMVYLPKGTWYDFWTREKVEGGSYILKDAPLNVCPMYLKAGSILPKYPVQQYVGQKKITELTLAVTPGKGSYHHFQDNGEDYGYKDGEYNEYLFTLEGEGHFRMEMLHHGFDKMYESLLIQYCGQEMRIPIKGEIVEIEL